MIKKINHPYSLIILYTITIIGVLLLVCSNCKTVSVQQDTQKVTTNSKILGTVGVQKDFVLEQSYNNTALPIYKKRLKVEVTSVVFNKATYKAYSHAKALQNATVSIQYVDSVRVKPQFLKLELTDRVEILNALNGKSNQDVKSYLQNKEQSHIVSGISMALNQQDFNVNKDMKLYL